MMAGMRPPLNMTRSSGLCTVVWTASDPNQDQLTYSVAIRAESETPWTMLVDKTDDTFFSFDTSGFREGRYFVKVTASDEPSNTPDTARTAEAISDAFLIDNTPPALTVKKQEVDEGPRPVRGGSGGRRKRDEFRRLFARRQGRRGAAPGRFDF